MKYGKKHNSKQPRKCIKNTSDIRSKGGNVKTSAKLVSASSPRKSGGNEMKSHKALYRQIESQ